MSHGILQQVSGITGQSTLSLAWRIVNKVFAVLKFYVLRTDDTFKVVLCVCGLLYQCCLSNSGTQRYVVSDRLTEQATNDELTNYSFPTDVKVRQLLNC